MKSFAANFTRLLGEALTEQNLVHVEHFFLAGPTVAKCILPYKLYVRKMAVACGKISMMYSRLTANAIILGFNALKHLVQWQQDDENMFETIMKKMYNEFARESRTGGGGFDV